MRNELKLTTHEHYTTISTHAPKNCNGPHVRSQKRCLHISSPKKRVRALPHASGGGSFRTSSRLQPCQLEIISKDRQPWSLPVPQSLTTQLAFHTDREKRRLETDSNRCDCTISARRCLHPPIQLRCMMPVADTDPLTWRALLPVSCYVR